MKRLVGLVTLAAALIGCNQAREGIRPTAGLSPAALPPGLPPIERQVNAGPAPTAPPSPDPSRPVRVAGFEPGVNGDGPIDPPRLPTAPAMAAPPAVGSPPPTRVAAGGTPAAHQPEPAPPEAMASAPTAEASEPAPPRASAPDRPAAEADAEVGRASAAVAVAVEPVVGQPVGEWAARVDNDIITWHELQTAVGRRLREVDPEGKAPADVRTALASNMLDYLIDRSLVIQKARRNELKDAKRWELFQKGAVEFFERERLPGLIRQNKAEDRYELERILSDRGESLDEHIDSFRHDFVYQWYLANNVTTRIRVDLPEMRAYYFENRDHEAFHRDAELTWRELVVRFANHPTREAARAKMDEALARLGRGEPFEAVARSIGEGPNAEQGGLWTTAPGSYAVAAVNQALASLEPGQVGTVVEGPSGLHLVRLESDRPAGRMSFEEAQDAVRDVIRERKEAELIADYIKDLYREAVVTTVFSEYVPRHLRDEGAGG